MATGLLRSGSIDKQTMREFDALLFPSGPSLKLLNLIDRKGVDALV